MIESSDSNKSWFNRELYACIERFCCTCTSIVHICFYRLKIKYYLYETRQTNVPTVPHLVNLRLLWYKHQILTKMDSIESSWDVLSMYGSQCFVALTCDIRQTSPTTIEMWLPYITQVCLCIPRQLRYIRDQLCQESKLHTNSRRFGYKVTGRSYFADHRHHYPCRILRLRFFIDLVASSS